MKPKRALCLLAALVLCFGLMSTGIADGVSMRVINCNEWVSLWAKASDSSVRLVKVPLGAVVTNCSPYNSTFTACEYNGKRGYIKSAYLEEVGGAEGQNGEAEVLIPYAEEGSPELGTMKVVNCEEWVSLWKKPAKNAERILKVSLGSYVYNCSVYNESYIKCEYNGITGYILSDYLEKADATAPVSTEEPDPEWYDENVWVMGESEPVDTSISSPVSYPYVELTAAGETELSEKIETENGIRFLYGVRVKNANHEQLLVGCYDANLQPVWGRSVTSDALSELKLLSVFTGGTAETPYAMIYSAEKGLQAIDLFTGEEVWHISSKDISLGASVCYAVNTDGTLYIAGHNGPHPVAVSVRGGVMWAADPQTEDVYGAYRITLSKDGVLCDYESNDNSGTRSHYAVLYSYYGETLDVSLSFAP